MNYRVSYLAQEQRALPPRNELVHSCSLLLLLALAPCSCSCSSCSLLLAQSGLRM